jgi:anionic cell wall polymer biosynthesis LytR-Cps2A-Psr (LCP) family protein
MLKSVVSEAISPGSWNRYPQVASAIAASVDTNLPVWQWPRLGLAVLRAVVGNSIDSSTISREMTSSYITSGGADVLLPNWDVIRPYVKNMLGQ